MKKIAYIASTLLFYSISALLAFVFLFSILSYFEYRYDWQIPFVDIINSKAKVHVPLLDLHINIPFNYSIIIMWSVMFYYTLFFYALKNFFKVFINNNMFKVKSVKRLKFFMLLNSIPLVYIILFTTSHLIKGVGFRFQDDYFIVLAHFTIAFLMYLYLDVLKKGKHIKDENDLTI